MSNGWVVAIALVAVACGNTPSTSSNDGTLPPATNRGTNIIEVSSDSELAMMLDPTPPDRVFSAGGGVVLEPGTSGRWITSTGRPRVSEIESLSAALGLAGEVVAVDDGMFGPGFQIGAPGSGSDWLQVHWLAEPWWTAGRTGDRATGDDPPDDATVDSVVGELMDALGVPERDRHVERALGGDADVAEVSVEFRPGGLPSDVRWSLTVSGAGEIVLGSGPLRPPTAAGDVRTVGLTDALIRLSRVAPIAPSADDRPLPTITDITPGLISVWDVANRRWLVPAGIVSGSGGFTTSVPVIAADDVRVVDGERDPVPVRTGPPLTIPDVPLPTETPPTTAVGATDPVAPPRTSPDVTTTTTTTTGETVPLSPPLVDVTTRSVDAPLLLAGPTGLFVPATGIGFDPSPVVAADVLDARWIDDTIAFQLTDVELLRSSGRRPDVSFVGVVDGRESGPPTRVREYRSRDGWSVSLLDVGVVDGRPVMLVWTRFAMPAGIDDADDRLLLVDLDTFGETDLGRRGDWEHSIRAGRLTEREMVLVHADAGTNWIEVVSHDGRLLHHAPDGGRTDSEFGEHDLELLDDTSFSLAIDGRTLSVLMPRFDGDAFDPVLVVQTLDLDTGASATTEIRLRPNGVSIDAGFCESAAVIDGGVICDRSDGTPIVVDLDTGVVEPLDLGDALLSDQHGSRVRPRRSDA